MLRKLQRKTLMPMQIVGYALTLLVGTTIVVTAFQLYADIRPLLSQQTDVFKAHTVTVSKNVTLFKTANKESIYFSDDELRKIDRQDFVKKVAPFTSSSFEVSASISLTAGRHLSTELFFESVPDEYIDVRSDAWRWDSTSDFLPIIIPEDYLQLYNFGFAESQSLPVISNATVEQVTFNVIVSGNGHRRVYASRIVGFSGKINSILVPEEFLKWANEEFGNGSVDKRNKTSRLLVEFNDVSDEQIPLFFESNGLNISKDELESSKLLFLFRSALLFVFAVAAIIIILSVAFIVMSFSLIISKNRSMFKNLYNIGYPIGRISRFYQIVISAVTATVMVLSVIVALLVRHVYTGHLSSMFTIDGTVAPIYFTALILSMLLLITCNVAIRRSVSKTVLSEK